MKSIIKTMSIILLGLSITNISQSMQVAITVDDLPLNGQLPQGIKEIDITNQMLISLQKHKLKGVYGLINGNKLEQLKDGQEVLKLWVEAGQFLGNHTYSHLDLANASIDEYSRNIKLNDHILDKIMKNKNYRYFRYPFLSEGDKQFKRDAIRQYLFEEKYTIAPVTLDFFEYIWNDAYVRCMQKGDKEAISWLEKTYIQQALNGLVISHELSMMLFGRDIKYVLLVHLNAFTAHMMPKLLEAYENHNVKFISLSNALTDEVYTLNPNVVGKRTYTFLNQLRLSRGLSNPEKVVELYRSLPEEEINKICTE